MGYVALKTGGIRYTILIHMTTNLLGRLIIPLLFSIDNNNVTILIMVNSLILAFIGIVILLIKIKGKLKKGDC